MAMSDRVLLLNNGRIEQQGTPQEMYSGPRTLFTAEFMGSNNRLAGRLAEVKDGRARLEGAGWSLWGTLRGESTPGREAQGVIRLEQVRIAQEAAANRLQLTLSTSMYLGDRWEHLFRFGELPLRAYGSEELGAGDYWLEFPPERLWVF
jgi:iron(III) transport system ATP-binding protein